MHGYIQGGWSLDPTRVSWTWHAAVGFGHDEFLNSMESSSFKRISKNLYKVQFQTT